MLFKELKVNYQTKRRHWRNKEIWKASRKRIIRPLFVQLGFLERNHCGCKVIKTQGIYIDRDYRKEIVKTRRALKPYPHRAKQKGNRAYLSIGKLIINGSTYSLSSPESPLEDSIVSNNTGQENILRRRLSTSLEQLDSQKQNSIDVIEIDEEKQLATEDKLKQKQKPHAQTKRPLNTQNRTSADGTLFQKTKNSEKW